MHNKSRRAAQVFLLAVMATTTAVLAVTPSGGWELQDPSPNAKDYHIRVDVDPGTTYPDDGGFAPPSVYWAQYLTFEAGQKGYLGLQRDPNTKGPTKKRAIASVWDGIGAKGGAIPTVDCYEYGPCESIQGDYEWFVGHVYRFRVEISPRTASDDEGNWWMITLTDLTTHTKDILGELKTPRAWGGLGKGNNVFLEYYWGPNTCNALRHAKVTEAPIIGNYGAAKALASSTNYTYGDPHQCDAQYILPGMPSDEYGSLSLMGAGNSLILIGNTYRGLHEYGAFQNTAKAGLMFTASADSDTPYIYRAAHDGAYTSAFPAEGQDNADWVAVGRGYPIINDLFFRKQRLYGWDERQASYVREGDFFSYPNPYTDDVEFFVLTQKAGAWYFPTDKKDSANWKYYGRTPKPADDLTAALKVHNWGDNDNDRVARKGSLFHSTQEGSDAYYILKNGDAPYGSFPDRSKGEVDNTWWEYAGSKP